MRTKSIYLILYIVMCSVAVLLCSCDNPELDLKSNALLINLDKQSEVDTAYLQFKEASNNDVIPLANHLFHVLDTNEITDSLIQYASSATITEVVANADYWMAEYLYQAQRQHDALTLAQIALKEAETMNDIDLQTSVNSLLSAIYSRLGMFEEGLKCLQFCLDESLNSGNKENMSSDLNNMAAMFISLKQYDKAKTHIDRAIEIERDLQSQAGRDGVLAIRLGIASETYMLLNILDEAEQFAREAYEIDKAAGRDGKAAIRLSQLASVLQKKGASAEAKRVLGEAIPMLNACGNISSSVICENQMGDLALEENDLDEAEHHYMIALETASDNSYKYLKQRALFGLWNALQHTDMQSAAEYLKQYTALSDTLHSEATERQLANMQAQFEYAELQAENERLSFAHRLQTLWWAVGLIACISIIILLCYIIHVKNKANLIARQTDVMIDLASGTNVVVQESDGAQAANGSAEGGLGENGAKEEVASSEKQNDSADDKGSTASEMSPNDSRFVLKLVTFVNEKLAKEEPIEINDCASALCVSPRHFYRKVVAITGFTPTAYINRIKINRAKGLLATHPELSITDISVMSGFEDLAYFGRIFRKIEGQTPTQYRSKL